MWSDTRKTKWSSFQTWEHFKGYRSREKEPAFLCESHNKLNKTGIVDG